MAAFIGSVERAVKDADKRNEKLVELKRLKVEIENKIVSLEEGLKDNSLNDDFSTMRSDLAKALALHFREAIFDNLLPFYGVAPLFGLNPQVPVPCDARPMDELGMRMVTTEPSRDIKRYSMCTVMFGIWTGILKLDDDHPVFPYKDEYENMDIDTMRYEKMKPLIKFLIEGSVAKQLPTWMTRSSDYIQEYHRRGGHSNKAVSWRLLVDYMKNGTCSTEKGNYKHTQKIF